MRTIERGLLRAIGSSAIILAVLALPAGLAHAKGGHGGGGHHGGGGGHRGGGSGPHGGGVHRSAAVHRAAPTRHAAPAGRSSASRGAVAMNRGSSSRRVAREHSHFKGSKRCTDLSLSPY